MIYLDSNATATLRPAAKEAVERCFFEGGVLGNPSSVHGAGRRARHLVTEARRKVSRLLTQGKNEHLRIIFTSGGTESGNVIVHGFLPEKPTHVVASQIEHAAILEPIKILEQSGCEVSWIAPERDGRVAAERLVENIRPSTDLATLMGANNESGAVQPVAESVRALRGSGFGGAFVSDYTQVIGKSLENLETTFALGLDGVSFSAHKLGAPTGLGVVALPQHPTVCRSFRPLIVGGAQEEGMRGGSENLLGIVALGEVAHTLLSTLEGELAKSHQLREELWEILSTTPHKIRRLTPENSIPNTLLLQVPGCRGDDLVVALDLRGVCVSTGAACSSGKQRLSHVALAMGLSPSEAREVVRISLDWSTTKADVLCAAKHLIEAISLMQEHSQ